jgi:hypothetical protein
MSVKISIYTFVKDGIYQDFHVVEMLKHHLELADEIIVNEGYSSDGTYERIKDIDPKIRVFRNRWDRSDPKSWHRKFKDHARRLCTGDWCILLDCDEFIADWQFADIRRYLSNTHLDIVPVHYVHFFGNHRVYNANPEAHVWPVHKRIIHRNLEDVEVWGDGGEVRRKAVPDSHEAPALDIECHHFGYVRNPARLRQKWRTQHLQYSRSKWDRTPGFVFDLLPFDWFDEQFLGDLRIYDGPVVRSVEENPREFVRDDYRLLDFLLSRSAAPAE